jgi:hypothetical protein
MARKAPEPDRITLAVAHELGQLRDENARLRACVADLHQRRFDFTHDEVRLITHALRGAADEARRTAFEATEAPPGFGDKALVVARGLLDKAARCERLASEMLLRRGAR